MASLVRAYDEPVAGVAFLDATRIVSASSSLKLWRAGGSDASATAEAPLACIATATAAYDQGVCTMAADAANNRVVTTSLDCCIRLWDVGADSIRLNTSVQSSPSDVWATAVSSVGAGPARVAGGGHAGRVHVWAAEHDVPRVAEIQTPCDFVTSLAFSPDGRFIAAAGMNGVVCVCDSTHARVVLRTDAHFMPVRSVSFSPDGATLFTASDDRTIRAWDVSGGATMPAVDASEASPAPLMYSLAGHGHAVNALAMAQDKPVLASAGSDRTVRVWDTRTRACVRVCEGHTDRLACVAWNPTATRVVSGSDSGALAVHTISGL